MNSHRDLATFEDCIDCLNYNAPSANQSAFIYVYKLCDLDQIKIIFCFSTRTFYYLYLHRMVCARG